MHKAQMLYLCRFSVKRTEDWVQQSKCLLHCLHSSLPAIAMSRCSNCLFGNSALPMPLHTACC